MSLIKPSEGLNPKDFKPKTVIWVGNGAVKNGAEPLRNMIMEDPLLKFTYEEHLNNGGFKEKYLETNWTEILAFNALSFRMRRSAFLDKLHKAQNDEEIEKCQKEFAEILDEFVSRREKLAEAYRKATKFGTISLREEFKTFLRERYAEDPSTAIITTNWDSLLWNDSEAKNVIQLHGLCSHPLRGNTLILPADFVGDEKDLWNVLANNFNSKNSRQAIRDCLEKYYFRGKKSQLDSALDHLRDAHKITMDWLSNPDLQRIYAWGIGFHAYDAEVLSLCNFVLKRKFDDKAQKHQVIVHNPDPTHHRRAHFFLGDAHLWSSEKCQCGGQLRSIFLKRLKEILWSLITWCLPSRM